MRDHVLQHRERLSIPICISEIELEDHLFRHLIVAGCIGRLNILL